MIGKEANMPEDGKGAMLQIEYVPLKSIKPWKENPRRIGNRDAVKKLADLISQYGFLNPIVVDQEGIIRAGHLRWEAARRLGLKEVPILRVNFPSKTDAELYAVGDNAAAEWSMWDDVKLRAVVEKHARKRSREELAKKTGMTKLELSIAKESEQHLNESSVAKKGRIPLRKTPVMAIEFLCEKCGHTWTESRR